MSNPYQSPQYDPQMPARGDFAGKVVPSGLVHQVRVVAILNGVQGGLEILMGLLFVAMAFFVPAMIAMDKSIQNQNPAGPPPEAIFWMMLAIYGGMGAGGLIAGTVRIIATFKNWHYRSRMFGIVSLALGMLSATTCYCIPTAIGMLIYGLIVYLNPSVAMAFELAEQGEPVDKILYEFSAYHPHGGKVGP